MKILNFLTVCSFSIVIGLSGCGGNATTSTEGDSNLTRVPNPVQQALVEDAPAEAGAMVNTLLQSDSTSENNQAFNFLKSAVLKEARAAISDSGVIPEGSACEARSNQPQIGEITFVQNFSGSNLPSGSYGAQTSLNDPTSGEIIYNYQVAFTEADKDYAFCSNSANERVDVADDPTGGFYDEESELFTTFNISEKVIRCDGIRTPANVADQDAEVDVADVEIIEDYVAISGVGVSRMNPNSDNANDPYRVSNVPLVVYGSFTFNHVVDGAIEGDGVNVDCTFLISASGFFMQESACTDANGTVVELNAELNGNPEGRTCELVGNLADI